MTALWHRDPLRPLRRILGKGKLLTAPEELVLYGFDATGFRGRPAAVVMAESTRDIQATVKFALDAGSAVVSPRLTVTPRGAGSGLSGGSVPVEGGIVLSCERMRSIISLDPDRRIAVIQPGVVTSSLQEAARRHQLFYPPDPSSNSVSTIGGNVAENAGGLRCFKYGVTGHYVLGVEFVDGEAELRRTGILDEEGVEPDLTPLMVGSEGTLGVFTRIALRFIPAPEAMMALSAFFLETEAALTTVEEIISRGWIPSVLEYIDHKALKAAAEFTGTDYPDAARALLLIELDGSKVEVEDLFPKVKSLLEGSALKVDVANDQKTGEQLWKLRRAVSTSLIRLASGKINEDVTVPRGSLAELARRVSQIERSCGLDIPVYGHAGDGNLHVVVMFDAKNTEAVRSAEGATREVFRVAIELGGTITGEHGVGYAKRDYLPWQQPDTVIKLARRIKGNLDPQGIFNPGKIFI